VAEGAKEKWIALFESKGWFKNGKPVTGAVINDVGVGFGSGTDSYIGLRYVVDVTDEFLVVEYHYDAGPLGSLITGHKTGWTRMWIPWAEIRTAFENFDRK
jgi:hypothetical protein